MHKVDIYKEYCSLCPLVGIGTLPTPLSPASKPLPPEPRGGGGAHSPGEKSLALCLLSALHQLNTFYISPGFDPGGNPTKGG